MARQREFRSRFAAGIVDGMGESASSKRPVNRPNPASCCAGAPQIFLGRAHSRRRRGRSHGGLAKLGHFGCIRRDRSRKYRTYLTGVRGGPFLNAGTRHGFLDIANTITRNGGSPLLRSRRPRRTQPHMPPARARADGGEAIRPDGSSRGRKLTSQLQISTG